MYSYYCKKCDLLFEIKNKPRKNRFTGLCRDCSAKEAAINRVAISNELQKTCKKCNEIKPANEENFLKNKKGYFYPYCRQCKNKYLKERYVPSTKKKLSEEELKSNKKSRYQSDKTNKWQKLLINSSRHNAKRYGKEFDIDENDILELYNKQNHKCYWFGIELIPSVVNRSPYKPSIDRLDCNLGYVKGNIVLSCMAANIGRNNCDAEIFAEFCENLRKKNE
jgi:hypothetical protein